MRRPTHGALQYSTDPVRSWRKSITVAPLMNAANIAVKCVDDPRPCHVLCNEVNELTEKLTFSGRKDMTLFRVKAGFAGRRLKREQEWKSNRGCRIHTLCSISLSVCVVCLAHIQRQAHMQTGAGCAADCVANSCV